MPTSLSSRNNSSNSNNVVIDSSVGSNSKNRSSNLSVYNNSLIIDSAKVDNLYFNCASYNTKRPIN